MDYVLGNLVQSLNYNITLYNTIPYGAAINLPSAEPASWVHCAAPM